MKFESHIEQEIQKKLFRYWDSKKTGSELPGRSDIHPEEIVRLLPHVGLIDVLSENQFRYRLIGTEMVNLFQKDFTGMNVLDSKKGEYGKALTSLYADAAEYGSAVYSRSLFLLREDISIDVSRLVLPLSSDKKTVDMLLFSTIPLWEKSLTKRIIPIFEHATRFEETYRVIETLSE